MNLMTSHYRSNISRKIPVKQGPDQQISGDESPLEVSGLRFQELDPRTRFGVSGGMGLGRTEGPAVQADKD